MTCLPSRRATLSGNTTAPELLVDGKEAPQGVDKESKSGRSETVQLELNVSPLLEAPTSFVKSIRSNVSHQLVLDSPFNSFRLTTTMRNQNNSRAVKRLAPAHRESTEPPIEEDTRSNDINVAFDILRQLTAIHLCHLIYSFAIRVLRTRDELIKAVDEHVAILKDSNRSFPQGYCPIAHWDVSNVTDFSGVFDAWRNHRMKYHFNPDVSLWDVSKGTSFCHMFRDCRAFNCDLSAWNVGNATDFARMFWGCEVFTSDLSAWNVASATHLPFMFKNCFVFNSDLSGWNVANVDNFSNMFSDCHVFNADLSRWNVANATDICWMFFACRVFNADLSRWNVANATNLCGMFQKCYVFNSDLSGWNVANVTNFNLMFQGCRSFRSDLSGWNVTHETLFGVGN